MKLKSVKPNPIGKDKSEGKPIVTQLLGEWVVFQNEGSKAVNQGGLALAHTEFDTSGKPKPEPVIYWRGDSGKYINPGDTVRVHAGRSSDAGKMSSEDADGVTHHAFSGEDRFVLNNKEGDTIYLYEVTQGKYVLIDKAYYNQDPKSGAILVRSGDKFVEAPVSASYGGVTPAKQYPRPAIIAPSVKSA